MTWPSYLKLICFLTQASQKMQLTPTAMPSAMPITTPTVVSTDNLHYLRGPALWHLQDFLPFILHFCSEKKHFSNW